MLFRWLKNLFRRPPIQMGRVDNSRIHRTRLRNAQFVSFIAESGSLQGWSSDRYESQLRWRKRIKAFLGLCIASGGAWVIIESARALTLF
jgi:hypothetical protein